MVTVNTYKYMQDTTTAIFKLVDLKWKELANVKFATIINDLSESPDFTYQIVGIEIDNPTLTEDELRKLLQTLNANVMSRILKYGTPCRPNIGKKVFTKDIKAARKKALCIFDDENKNFMRKVTTGHLSNEEQDGTIKSITLKIAHDDVFIGTLTLTRDMRFDYNIPENYIDAMRSEIVYRMWDDHLSWGAPRYELDEKALARELAYRDFYGYSGPLHGRREDYEKFVLRIK